MQTTDYTVNTVREATARLLATENITVIEDPKAPSAYFDLKSRTLGLPVWKNITQEMYDMLVGHEVGHALFTPNGNGGWVDAAKRIAADAGFAGDPDAERTAQSYINIVEDARIERLIKERYPGLRRDFFTAYSEFAKRDIFKIGGTDIATLGLADRLNLHFKIGFTQPIPFHSSERVFINRMETAVTWEEVVAIATDLFQFQSQGQGGAGNTPNPLSDDGEEGEGEESGESSGKGEGEGNTNGKSGRGKTPDIADDGESGAGDADGEGEESGQSGSDAAGSGDSESQSDGENDLNDTREGATAERTKGHGVNTAPVKPTAAKTASSLDDASASLRDKNARGRNYIYLPKAVVASDFVIPFTDFIDTMRRWETGKIKEVHGYKTTAEGRERQLRATDELMKGLVEDTRGSILSFVREFEMLKTADEHRRTVESKSGRLDMDQAWKYRISDNLFKVATTMRDGKNHGFVMFIDWSGSMQPLMEQTMRQLYILFQFCKKVGVPFDVYAFGVGIDSNLFPNLKGRKANRVQHDDGRNEVQPNVELLHIMSSRANARDLQDAFRYCLSAACTGYYGECLPVALGGSTPLDSTIVVARDLVNEFRKTTKVQIVNTVFLTDGDATDNLLTYGTKGHKNWSGPTILRDGHREWAGDGGYHSDGTGLLLRWFKDNTGSNTVGIFVTSRLSYATHHFDPAMKPEDKFTAEKQFKADGWCSVKALGFDQYFVLRGNVVDTDAAMEAFEQKDASTMTATQIKNAYIKAVESRNGARGMIHRFVKTVA